MKGVVVVADNPLIVAAVRSGLRKSAALELLGYVRPREATAARIFDAGADVVLVDEADYSQFTIALIRALKERGEQMHVIALVLALEGDWLQRSFEAGADGAISKSVRPPALAILVGEVVAGHIVHAPVRLRAATTGRVEPDGDHSTLTDREFEILRLVSSGATNGVIARQLWITQQTVKFHVSNIYRKLGVANRTEACHYAHVNGIAARPELSVAEPREALANAS